MCCDKTPLCPADPRAKLSPRALWWALETVVSYQRRVARFARGFGVAWDFANDAVLAEGRRVLINDPARRDGVTSIGVDEHVWRHTRRGDRYVTVIIDLTGISAGAGPARLLDMVEGRCQQAFKTWLAERPKAWHDRRRVGRDGRIHRLQDSHTRSCLRGTIGLLRQYYPDGTDFSRWSPEAVAKGPQHQASQGPRLEDPCLGGWKTPA